MTKINRESLSTELVDLGNKAHAAADRTESEYHAAQVAMLRLRLTYFTGNDDGPFRGDELDELCAELTGKQVHHLIDWCWGSYLGGMEHMREGGR